LFLGVRIQNQSLETEQTKVPIQCITYFVEWARIYWKGRYRKAVEEELLSVYGPVVTYRKCSEGRPKETESLKSTSGAFLPSMSSC